MAVIKNGYLCRQKNQVCLTLESIPYKFDHFNNAMKPCHVHRASLLLLTGSGLVILAGIFLMLRMYPIHLNSNMVYGQDPAYQYLFAGVDILQGHAPLHNDHPGTPLQTLIAITIAIVWFFLKTTGFETAGLYDAVLLHPEFYLAAISTTLLLLSSLASYYFGQAVYRVTQSLSLALSCQLSPIIFASVVPNLIYPSPEALLITISVMLMGVMAPVILNHATLNKGISQQVALPTGLLCGLGLATKITFFPIFGILLLLKYPKQILKAFFFALIGWSFGVLPIFERLPGMFSWFYRVLTHTGTHGGGSQGLFDLNQFKMSVNWLISHFTLLYIICLFLTLIFLLIVITKLLFSKHIIKKNNISSNSYLINFLPPFILSLIVVAQTIMVAKHPGVTYMIPVLPITLIGGVWLIYQFNFLKTPSDFLKKLLTKIWFLVILVISGIAFSQAYTSLTSLHKKGLQSHTEINNQISKYNDPILIGAFNCNFLECAEWFGMLLVPEMELRMKPFTPNFYHYDIFSKRLHTPGIGELTNEQTEQTILDLIAQNRNVLLISPEFEQLKRFKLEKIYSTEIQNLYRITGLSNQ